VTATDRPLRTTVRNGAEGCIARRQPFVASALSGGYCDAFDPGTLGRLEGELRDEYRKAVADALRLFVVRSYQTPIAWVAVDEQDRLAGEWRVPDARYSPTTSQHSHVVRAAVRYAR
jgi:hypothetical protein